MLNVTLAVIGNEDGQAILVSPTGWRGAAPLVLELRPGDGGLIVGDPDGRVFGVAASDAALTLATARQVFIGTVINTGIRQDGAVSLRWPSESRSAKQGNR